jgi:hypothetical protein
MLIKKLATFSLIIAAIVNLNTSYAFANRNLCSPQNADMVQVPGGFVSTCSWSNWTPGTDVNAIITLHGKQTVHAECQFSGPDSVAAITGNKHAFFKPLALPGNAFGFDIQYRADINDSDDNQNIQIYLNTKNPDEADTLYCQFTAI